MKTSIAAGTEVEHCKFVRAPDAGLLVHDDTVVFTPGSHHVLVYATSYDEIPTVDDAGDPLEMIGDEGVFDCSNGPQLHFTVDNLVAGSQSGDGEAMARFPPGVGMRVQPGALLLMNAHYINTTTETIEPDVTVTLRGLPEEELVEEGGLLFWYDLFIKAPAMASSHTTTVCNMPHDVTLMNIQSHMHARGVDYSAVVIAPDGARDEIYTNDRWEDVEVGVFEPGRPIAAGSRVEYTCHYDNNTDSDIFQGPRTTDEMCMLIGSYYPAKPEVDLCSYFPEQPQLSNFMGAEWVGQGTTNCNDSLACFQQAVGGDGNEFETLERITECVIDADPAVSAAFSAVVGCSLGAVRTGQDPLSTCASAYVACTSS